MSMKDIGMFIVIVFLRVNIPQCIDLGGEVRMFSWRLQWPQRLFEGGGGGGIV